MILKGKRDNSSCRQVTTTIITKSGHFENQEKLGSQQKNRKWRIRPGEKLMSIQVGYCTNVHAGPDLAQTRANLERYALEVKRRHSPNQPMGIGLWLAAPAARKLLAENALSDFAGWLQDVGLVPFTLNGFPFGDFHQEVVKHRVYEPTWLEPARFEYTRDLIKILHGLLPPGMNGSISTLPLLWGEPQPSVDTMRAAAENLQQLAEFMDQLESETGRFICVCLEPEPGCALELSYDVVRFFEDYLLEGRQQQTVRRYIRVCHDICHQAVMFENQSDVLMRYWQAGIHIGKIQVSSAVAMPLDEMQPGDRPAALNQMAGFNENRYLHQTVVQPRPQTEPTFYDDLPQALASQHAKQLTGEWRTHFHVPIYLERFGLLRALQQHVLECLETTAKLALTNHFEVKTYAWGVLPKELQVADLAEGIAREMDWFKAAWGRLKEAK